MRCLIVASYLDMFLNCGGIMVRIHLIFCAVLAAVTLIVGSAYADADMPSTPVSTAVSAGLPPLPTSGSTPPLFDGELMAGIDPVIRLTPDKIDVLKLDQNAVNVVVGNNKHLMAVMETPRQVMLIPRAPGATFLQVLNAKGDTILARSVIVAAPKTDYVRIRRSCAGKKVDDCEQFSVFYCPDMCHEIHVTQDTKSGGAAVPAEVASSGEPASTVPEGLNDQPISGATGPGNIGAAAAMP